jgi:hypothetical protein
VLLARRAVDPLVTDREILWLTLPVAFAMSWWAAGLQLILDRL